MKMQTHAHTHAHTHMHTHMHAHTYTHTCTHTHTHAHTHARTHTCPHTHMHNTYQSRMTPSNATRNTTGEDDTGTSISVKLLEALGPCAFSYPGTDLAVVNKHLQDNSFVLLAKVGQAGYLLAQPHSWHPVRSWSGAPVLMPKHRV